LKTYKTIIKKQAEKFIESRTKKEQERLISAIKKLPYADHIVKLQGKRNLYRLRVGDVRIQYEKHDDVLVILVIRADNRDDAY